MKRDLDIIRTILLEIEARTGEESCLSYDSFPDEPEGETPERIYNVRLLVSSGYVEGKNHAFGADITSLTWEGHDLLDAIRDETVWTQTKDKVKKGVVSTSLEVVKGVAEGITKGLIFGAGG